MAKVLRLRRRSIDDLIYQALSADGRLIPTTEEAVACMEAILAANPADPNSISAGTGHSDPKRRPDPTLSSHAAHGVQNAVLRLFEKIGAGSVGVAAAAADALVARARSQPVIREIERKLHAAMSAGEKAVLLDVLGSQCRVMAHCEARAQLPVSDALTHLRSPTTHFYPLVDGPSRRIFAALGAVGDARFKATWLTFPHENYVFLIRDEGVGHMTKSNVTDRIVHEFTHLSGELRARATSVEPASPVAEPEPYLSYVEQQYAVEPLEKLTVARWARFDAPVPLAPCAGLFFDAGSGCKAVYDVTCEGILTGQVSNLAIKTNSLPVINGHAKALRSPRMNGTSVDVVGDTFDSMHEAFFGPSAHDKLNSAFMPSAVYIGTNGIEFAEFGGTPKIHFGYHGSNDKEGVFKKLLFQCPAKSRVIVATPAKIGNTSGNVMDLLALEKLDNSAPIYLVTVEPESHSTSRKAFEQSKRIFLGATMQAKLAEMELEFFWIILERNPDAMPKVKERLVGFERPTQA